MSGSGWNEGWMSIDPSGVDSTGEGSAPPPRRRLLRRFGRRGRFLLVAACVALACSAGVFAWFSASGSGTASAGVGSLGSPAPVSATSPSTGVAHVTWGAVTSPSGVASDVTYTVERSTDSSTWVPVSVGGGNTCNGSLSQSTVSCDDYPASAGDYYYRVTAFFTSWTSSAQTSASVHVVTDTTPPTSSISFPVDNGAYNVAGWNGGCATVGICGTANDPGAGASGVSAVAVSIQRSSDSDYWNGTAWIAAQTFNSASTTDSWAHWSLPLAATNFTDGVTYSVRSKAIDGVSNVQSPLANASFIYDTTGPTIVRATMADATANTAGFITQGGSYYAYAQVTDSASGVASVSADLHTITTGATTLAMGTSGGPWTINGQSYNYRTPVQTADSPLLESGNPYGLGIVAFDNAGNNSSANDSANVDNTGPGGGSVTINSLVGAGSLYSTSTTLSLTLNAGSDAGVGNAAPSTFLLRRASATLSSVDGITNGACGSFGSFSTIATGPSSSYTDNAAGGVASGNCYRYQYVVRDKLGIQTTYTSSVDVKVDTGAPTVPLVTASNAAGNTFVAINGTVWVNGQTGKSGTFDVSATASDGQSGILKVNFPAFGSTSSTDDATSPFSLHYAWGGSVTAGGKTVTATNNASLTGTSSFTVSSDTSNPTGGSITANGSGTASYNTTGTIALAVTNYGDGAGSGIASNVVTRATATLINNVCGGFGGSTVVSGGSDSGLANGCYQYTLTGTDNVGNVSTSVSAVVMVDTTPPSTPTLSFTGLSSNAFYSSGQNTLYFRPVAGGAFTVTAASSDPETGIKSGTAGYAFSSIAANNFSGTLSAGQDAYTFGATATQPATDPTILATNNASTNSSTASYHLKADTTPPTGGTLTVNGTAASSGGSSSTTTSTNFTIVSRTDYSEAQSPTASGLSTSTLTVQSATLTDTTCGNAGSGGPFASAISVSGTTQPSGIIDGYCYIYTLAGVDNVGNAVSISTTVKVPLASGLANNLSSPCSLSSSVHSCSVSSVGTASGQQDLVLVFLNNANSGVRTIGSVTGPFSNTASPITSVNFDTSAHSYLYAWKATGSGTTGAVTVNFDSGATAGTVFVDIVELSDSSTANNSGTDSGTSKTASTSLAVGTATDGEIAVVGISSTRTLTVPAGFSTLAMGTPTGALFGSFSVRPAQSATNFSLSSAGANPTWGTLAIEVGP